MEKRNKTPKVLVDQPRILSIYSTFLSWDILSVDKLGSDCGYPDSHPISPRQNL